MTPVLEYPARPRDDVAMPEVPRRRAEVRNPRRLLVLGLALGALANAWLPSGPLGLGFTAVIYLWGAALLWAGGREAWQSARGARVLLAGALFFATMISVRASDDLTRLNVLACFGLLGLTTYYWSPGRSLVEARVRELLGAFFQAVIIGPLSAFTVVRESMPQGELISPTGRTKLKSALRATAIAVPVVFLFGELFLSADALFARTLERAILGTGSFHFDRLLSNAFGVLGFAALAAGFLALSLRRHRTTDAAAASRNFEVLKPTDALGISGALVGLFTLFNLAQFGAFTEELPEDLTWSEYARQGFEQLLAVGLLTLAVVIFVPRLMSEPPSRPLKALLTSLVALCEVVLLSAVHRLELYEEAYGYTSARVMGHAFALTLGALLAWRAITLWKFEKSFGVGLVASAALFVGSLDVLNLDAFIAEKNIARTDRILDEGYLGRLSPDASDVLEALEIAPNREQENPPGFAHWNWSRARASAHALGVDR